MGDRTQRPACQWTNRRDNDIGTKALTRSSVHKSTGMDGIPGTVVAWNWEGHGRLTAAAIDDLRKQLPPNIQEILRWVGTGRQTQNRDLTDIPSLGHWTPEGQRHHFMKYGNQKDQDAYKVAVDWIFDEATTAAQLLSRLLGPRRRYQEHGDWGFGTEQDSVGPHLGNALHSLQDSFSPGHVQRDTDLVIRGINIYDEENKHPTAPGKLGHAAYDETWKTPDGSLSPLGQAAADASVVLLLFFLRTAFGQADAAKIQKQILLEKYLRLDLSPVGVPARGVEKKEQAAGRWIG